jgi:serine/threonine protein kinase
MRPRILQWPSVRAARQSFSQSKERLMKRQDRRRGGHESPPAAPLAAASTRMSSSATPCPDGDVVTNPARPRPGPAKQQPAKPAFSFLQPPVQPDEIGRLGPYRVLRLLGKGGMGYVFLAEDCDLCRHVALKVMRPNEEGDVAGLKRFLGEARIMAALKHAHLVPVFQVGQQNGVIYLAM